MNRTVLPVVLVLALLSGCATTRGPAKVLSSTGHYFTADHGVAAAFKVAADQAEACRVETELGRDLHGQAAGQEDRQGADRGGGDGADGRPDRRRHVSNAN